MSKRNIHIERLQIRTRGISAETARILAGDLGPELLSQLTQINKRGNTRIARIDAGTTQADQVGKQVIRSIKKRMT